MLLVIEIALTVWLCLRYRDTGRPWWHGLIPLGVLFVLSICGGLTIGVIGALLNGGSYHIAAGSFAWLDIIAIGVLGFLLYKTK